MKGLGGALLTLVLVIAAARAIAAALAILLVLAIIYGFFCHPTEMLGLLIFCLIAGLMQAQPLASLIVIGLIALMAARKGHKIY